MQHDDRERDEAAGAPDDDNAQQGAQGDAQRAAPERAEKGEEPRSAGGPATTRQRRLEARLGLRRLQHGPRRPTRKGRAQSFALLIRL